jgi:hypothetical protein
MPSITIDSHTYDLNTLSPDARAQLTSLQFVDAKLARLQTARVAYSKALQTALLSVAR